MSDPIKIFAEQAPTIRIKSKSQASDFLATRNKTLMSVSLKKSPLDTNDSIRRKVSSYMHSRPVERKLEIKLKKKTTDVGKGGGGRLYQPSKDLPMFESIPQFLSLQKEIMFIHSQKLENGFDQCFFFYLELIKLAVDNDLIVSKDRLNRERSFFIEVLQFVCESLFESGLEKLAFIFSAKAIKLCEIYQEYLKLGKFLLMMGRVTRRLSWFDRSIVLLKKALEYIWRDRGRLSNDIEVGLYDELSHCYLQMNMVDESKIFAQKYEIGSVEREDSKIIELSKELVTSVQKRKQPWQGVSRESIEFLLSFDIDSACCNRQPFMGRPDQKRILSTLKMNFQYAFEAFMQDDMFFYQIPTPLQIQEPEHVKSLVKKRSSMGVKFISRNYKSTSLLAKKDLPIVKQFESIKESIIFNFRGVGVCKKKLSIMLRRLFGVVRIKSMPGLNQISSSIH